MDRTSAIIAVITAVLVGITLGLLLGPGLDRVGQPREQQAEFEVCKPDGSQDCAPIDFEEHRGQYIKGYADAAVDIPPDPWSGYSPEEREAIGHAGEWSYAGGYLDGLRGLAVNTERYAR